MTHISCRFSTAIAREKLQEAGYTSREMKGTVDVVAAIGILQVGVYVRMCVCVCLSECIGKSSWPCLSVCMSVCLSICLSVFLSFCLSLLAYVDVCMQGIWDVAAVKMDSADLNVWVCVLVCVFLWVCVRVYMCLCIGARVGEKEHVCVSWSLNLMFFKMPWY